ncbi:MAG: pyruvate ferredoxin oxidoreductase [Dehalococcoidales bacterium]|nr:pyruvate ferredoxin oxidoreductase [Dehalococcoidales bacterium]
MEVSIAVSEAVKLANADVIAAYPITPQTHIVEHLSELVAQGELNAEFIPVESEHSAMSACLGSAATGARTFTATAGQGLELMHEVVYVASSMRLPIVMAVTNRALSSPLSVWGDHSDVMSVRDTGWIQIFVENGQEAVDNIICAFRMAEDSRALLPVMVHLDGFHLSHMVEPVLLPDQAEVDDFLPPCKFPLPLDPGKPVTMGDFAPPITYTEVKWAQEINLEKSRETILDVWDKFAAKFGRKYNPIECYRCEDCDTLLMTMGSFSETAMMAIDKMREAGEKVGLFRIRLWRPFPYDDLRKAVKNAKTLIIMDRAISFGQGGPVATEIRSALYSVDPKPRVVAFVGGLGGRDIAPADFETIVTRGMEIASKGSDREFEIFGVRE